jgi:uncharacterized protein
MKKLLILTLCLMLFVGMIPPASATDTPKIVDEYDLLTTEQEEDLEEKARKIVDKYDMDVVIVTVWSLGGKSAEAYADDYFDYNGYGIGEDYSGCLFLLSMEYRDWAISTCGDSIYALTDYGIEQLFESCKDYLSDDRDYKAFDVYLDQLDYYFRAYENGSPIDGYHDSDVDDYIIYDPNDSDGTVHYKRQPGTFDIIRIVAVGVVAGLLIGGLVLWSLRSSMNTFRAQRNASSYIPAGSFHLTARRDVFLYSNVSKVRRQSNSGGGSGRSRGGGSSVHRSSSGRSHGGRSGKF